MPGLESAAFPAERRSHIRETASDPARLVTPSGQVFNVTVADRSLRGLRIYFADAGSLPTEVTILLPTLGMVYLARVVWRTAPYAGLLVTKSVDMRRATGPDVAELRLLWREHVVA